MQLSALKRQLMIPISLIQNLIQIELELFGGQGLEELKHFKMRWKIFFQIKNQDSIHFLFLN